VAVHRHSELLRAAIGSASNDYRLGGHEAPPAIMSVYLGQELEELLENIEMSGKHKSKARGEKYSLELTTIPELPKHSTDRNRTSPFAFTGNKFEFRAVGSQQSPSLPVTVLNAIVAESLDEIVTEIEKKLGGKRPRSKGEFAEAIVPVLQKYIAQSKAIRFAGDNYSESWEKEAKKRGLPNLHRSPEAFKALVAPGTAKVFERILRKEELASRYEIMLAEYIQKTEIEVRLMLDMFRTQILPVANQTLKNLSKGIVLFREVTKEKKGLLAVEKAMENLGYSLDRALMLANELDDLRHKALKIGNLALQADFVADEVREKMVELRGEVDYLESLSDDALWPLPKYRELLFFV
ncbi:MAG: glutamine synthetase, partial [Chlamydiia bacterium]|nr:glutamine synthetase [Chlamydiia bacterium]